ncbi:hypothetical protein Rhopal_005247-T1 [Rhodotorula paludigena]|uniref:Uncharacterized protein n=1 Tax=Rhodotorula paludigena TaxID=86838 RepID=A0AAV5GS81_9BASI|nr:hypothetical protein Rhopal_005247-T1 [Rhodotorula paludigena]
MSKESLRLRLLRKAGPGGAERVRGSHPGHAGTNSPSSSSVRQDSPLGRKRPLPGPSRAAFGTGGAPNLESDKKELVEQLRDAAEVAHRRIITAETPQERDAARNAENALEGHLSTGRALDASRRASTAQREAARAALEAARAAFEATEEEEARLDEREGAWKEEAEELLGEHGDRKGKKKARWG